MKPATYAEFWPLYLRAHAAEGNRILHAVGTLCGTGIFLGGVCLLRWTWCLGGIAVGYAFAWAGHFGVEGNRPATFGHPLWSFYSDYRMVFQLLLGTLEGELRKAGVPDS
ncbi:MAG: DUF962 domain-containing protein [Elusimicrobia bacterium]|nr:DUF962 domain-containing protein [Elusimicrobiota bacterium]